DIEGPDYGLCLKQVPYHVADGGILLPLVPFGIFLAVPKAQRQDLIGFYIRYQKCLIHEPGLFLQNRQHLVVDGVGKFPGLSRLGCYFDSSCKHGNNSFAPVSTSDVKLPIEADRRRWFLTWVESVLRPAA